MHCQGQLGEREAGRKTALVGRGLAHGGVQLVRPDVANGEQTVELPSPHCQGQVAEAEPGKNTALGGRVLVHVEVQGLVRPATNE